MKLSVFPSAEPTKRASAKSAQNVVAAALLFDWNSAGRAALDGFQIVKVFEIVVAVDLTKLAGMLGLATFAAKVRVAVGAIERLSVTFRLEGENALASLRGTHNHRFSVDYEPVLNDLQISLFEACEILIFEKSEHERLFERLAAGNLRTAQSRRCVLFNRCCDDVFDADLAEEVSALELLS